MLKTVLAMLCSRILPAISDVKNGKLQGGRRTIMMKIAINTYVWARKSSIHKIGEKIGKDY